MLLSKVWGRGPKALRFPVKAQVAIGVM
jgi:hypothetical protein